MSRQLKPKGEETRLIQLTQNIIHDYHHVFDKSDNKGRGAHFRNRHPAGPRQRMANDLSQNLFRLCRLLRLIKLYQQRLKITEKQRDYYIEKVKLIDDKISYAHNQLAADSSSAGAKMTTAAMITHVSEIIGNDDTGMSTQGPSGKAISLQQVGTDEKKEATTSKHTSSVLPTGLHASPPTKKPGQAPSAASVPPETGTTVPPASSTRSSDTNARRPAIPAPAYPPNMSRFHPINRRSLGPRRGFSLDIISHQLTQNMSLIYRLVYVIKKYKRVLTIGVKKRDYFKKMATARYDILSYLYKQLAADSNSAWAQMTTAAMMVHVSKIIENDDSKPNAGMSTEGPSGEAINLQQAEMSEKKEATTPKHTGSVLSAGLHASPPTKKLDQASSATRVPPETGTAVPPTSSTIDSHTDARPPTPAPGGLSTTP